MSRTYREPTKANPGRKGKRRDGEWYQHAKGCENGGNCDYCRGNRTHKNVRREPCEE